MPQLTVLSGLPGAGKSTIARAELAKTGAVLVGRDELRTAMVGLKDEALITLLLADLSLSLLLAGHDVVVDAWNLHPDDRARFEALAEEAAAEMRWLHVPTPVDVCVERDAQRPNANGEERVREAAAMYVDGLVALGRRERQALNS